MQPDTQVRGRLAELRHDTSGGYSRLVATLDLAADSERVVFDVPTGLKALKHARLGDDIVIRYLGQKVSKSSGRQYFAFTLDIHASDGVAF